MLQNGIQLMGLPFLEITFNNHLRKSFSLGNQTFYCHCPLSGSPTGKTSHTWLLNYLLLKIHIPHPLCMHLALNFLFCRYKETKKTTPFNWLSETFYTLTDSPVPWQVDQFVMVTKKSKPVCFDWRKYEKYLVIALTSVPFPYTYVVV